MCSYLSNERQIARATSLPFGSLKVHDVTLDDTVVYRTKSDLLLERGFLVSYTNFRPIHVHSSSRKR